MKILNAYCGIGGNRELWGDKHEITAQHNKIKSIKINITKNKHHEQRTIKKTISKFM